jgi:flagellar basal-body rod protein FlgC
MQFQTEALKLRSQRQELLSATSANADKKGRRTTRRSISIYGKALHGRVGGKNPAMPAGPAPAPEVSSNATRAGEPRRLTASRWTPSARNLPTTACATKPRCAVLNAQLKTMLAGLQGETHVALQHLRHRELGARRADRAPQRHGQQHRQRRQRRGSGRPAYRAKQVVFQAVPPGRRQRPAKVRVAGVVEDGSPARRCSIPSIPCADGQGYVTMPNVSIVDEMVNMLSASRSYQSSVEVMNTAKALLQKTLHLGS